MRLQIRMLGGFEVRPDGGAPLRLPTRKAEALVAILALRPGRLHQRMRIATLLWPASEEHQARGSLRQTLNLIRKTLRDVQIPGVQSVAGDLRLDPTGVEVDTVVLENALSEGTSQALERAADLYHGIFLDGFDLVEQPFVDWVRRERTRIGTRAINGLCELLKRYTEENRIDDGLRTGEQILALEPSVETVHRAMMLLHLRNGDRDHAIHQYQRCRTALMDQSGVDVSPATEALYERIQQGTNLAGSWTR